MSTSVCGSAHPVSGLHCGHKLLSHSKIYHGLFTRDPPGRREIDHRSLDFLVYSMRLDPSLLSLSEKGRMSNIHVWLTCPWRVELVTPFNRIALHPAFEVIIPRTAICLSHMLTLILQTILGA